MMIFRKALCITLLCFLALTVSAQRSEVGFGIGTFNYTGDLARGYNFLNSRPAGTVFYRSNVSNVVSLRAAVTAGKMAASDSRPIDPFAAQRKASFNIFVFEVSTAFEYHFLNWRETKRFVRFSPYMFGGLALFGMSGNNATKPEEYSNVQGAIPFGAGLKYVINPKWYVGLEFGARKTFFDYLDNVSLGRENNKNYKYGNPFDNDAYYFLGLSITRTFYDIPCPTNPYK
ncbi:MAG TPA: DUF6089 family protein [Chryseosolibacter sp.]